MSITSKPFKCYIFFSRIRDLILLINHGGIKSHAVYLELFHIEIINAFVRKCLLPIKLINSTSNKFTIFMIVMLDLSIILWRIINF